MSLRPAGTPPLRLQLVAGLHGGFLLGRGRAEGLAFAMLSPEGTARSFWAAALCLPAFLGLRLLGLSAGEEAPDFGRLLAAELTGYVVGWAGFALISRRAALANGRAERWPGFIAAWNWSNVVQYLLLTVLLLSPAGPLGTLLGLSALGYALWLEWFVARAGLGLDGLQAAGVVGLDLALSLLVAGLVERLAGG